MTLVSKLEGALDSRIGRAIAEYNMIEPNDRIMVATSGGKDSWALLFTLRRLAEKAPISFKIMALHVDANFPEQNVEPIEEYLKHHGFEYEILKTGIYDLMKMKLDPIVCPGQASCREKISVKDWRSRLRERLDGARNMIG